MTATAVGAVSRFPWPAHEARLKRQTTAKTAAKKKLGFPVPIRVWLKEDTYYNMVRECFESEEANRFFHTEKLVHLLDEHRAGKADNSRKIWTLYIFLVWYKIYFPECCGA